MSEIDPPNGRPLTRRELRQRERLLLDTSDDAAATASQAPAPASPSTPTPGDSESAHDAPAGPQPAQAPVDAMSEAPVDAMSEAPAETAENPGHDEDSDSLTEAIADHDAPRRAEDSEEDDHLHRQRLFAIGTKVLVVLLCTWLGLAMITQMRQVSNDQFTVMRQEDLVRYVDELGQRADELAQAREALDAELSELRAKSSDAQAVREAAEKRIETQRIIAGVVPVKGPGVTIVIADPQRELRARHLVNMLEELRNAGAEAIALNGIRITGSSWFTDRVNDLVADGERLDLPLEWKIIGDPKTISVALGIPGGALASVRSAGAEATVQEHEELIISEVRELPDPRYAEIVK